MLRRILMMTMKTITHVFLYTILFLCKTNQHVSTVGLDVLVYAGGMIVLTISVSSVRFVCSFG